MADDDNIDRREKALLDIVSWARAYPLTVFHEPDPAELKLANTIFKDYGLRLTIDAISASAMRHVLQGVINIAKDGLADEQGSSEREARPDDR